MTLTAPTGVSPGPGPLPVKIAADVALGIDDLVSVADGAHVELAPSARARIEAGTAVVEKVLASGISVYGLTNGLGHTRDQRVPDDALPGYQEQIILSHRGGIGAPLPTRTVRAAMAARVNGMARGGSGATLGAASTLVSMLNAGVHPVVPEVGSVGASDLMHLAAIAAVAIGEGTAEYGGTVMTGAEALDRAGIPALRPRLKDGLALVSANAVAVGAGALVVTQAEATVAAADVAAAVSLEAFEANLSIIDPVVPAAKPTPGHGAARDHLAALLASSDHVATEARSIQDPLSFRVIPQVHGAFRHQADGCRQAVEVELNSMSDNPLLVVEEGRFVHNGNFCPIGLALAFDALRPAIAHVALCSVRRLNHLTHSGWRQDRRWEKWVRARDGRPDGLVVYAAAALWADLRHLVGPASLDVTSLDVEVEDHATSAPLTVALAGRALDLLEAILACELLRATLSIEGDGGSGRLGRGTGAAFARVIDLVDALDPKPDGAEPDRSGPERAKPDMASAQAAILGAIRDGSLAREAERGAGIP